MSTAAGKANVTERNCNRESGAYTGIKATKLRGPISVGGKKNSNMDKAFNKQHGSR